MDRLDAQLLGDELADEGQRLLGGRVVPAGAGAYVVAVGPGDGVAVVAIGDEHVVAGEVASDGVDPIGVGDSLDGVLDAVDGDRAELLAGLAQQLGQTPGQGQAPHR